MFCHMTFVRNKKGHEIENAMPVRCILCDSTIERRQFRDHLRRRHRVSDGALRQYLTTVFRNFDLLRRGLVLYRGI